MSVHEYRTGSWIALVGDGAVALLHPEVGTAAVRELWELTRGGSRLGTWVEHLAGGGIRALPSFAMVEAHHDGLNVLVRGDLTVDVGGEQVTGTGFTTWREQVLPGGAGFTITAGGPAETSVEQAWLPVVGGIVLADSLRSALDGTVTEDNHAGLQLADGPLEAEEDLELTLMRSPALAAAIGRPSTPGPLVAEGAPGLDEAAASTDEAEIPEMDPADVAESDVPETDPPDVAEPDVPEADPADDAEYDHLLWSTEQLDAEDAETAAEDLAAAAPDAPGAGPGAAPSARPAPSMPSPDRAADPSADRAADTPAPATAEGTPPGGLEATQVPREDDELFAPPPQAAPAEPVHRVRWDDEPAVPPPAADPAAPAASSGLIDSVPWARPAAGAVPAAEPAPAAAVDQGDHDGETVMAGDLPAQADVPAVATEAAPAEEPVLELVMSTGPRVEVTRPVLLGRAPEATRFRGNAVPRLVTVPNPQRDISGTHVEIRPAGDHVVVTDMNSTNGTVLNLPGQPAFRLHPGTGVPVPPGGVIELGSGVSVTVVRAGEDA